MSPRQGGRDDDRRRGVRSARSTAVHRHRPAASGVRAVRIRRRRLRRGLARRGHAHRRGRRAANRRRRASRRRPVAAERDRARERRLVPDRAPRCGRGGRLPPRRERHGRSGAAGDRRQAIAADQLRDRGRRRAALDHGQHLALAARAGLPRRRRRRLRRGRRPARSAHRRRRPGLYQRARDRPGGPVALGQRNLRPAPVAFPAARRRLARATRDGDDLRQGVLPRRSRVRQRRATRGS